MSDYHDQMMEEALWPTIEEPTDGDWQNWQEAADYQDEAEDLADEWGDD